MNNEIILNEDNAISTLSRLSIEARKSEKNRIIFPYYDSSFQKRSFCRLFCR